MKADRQAVLVVRALHDLGKQVRRDLVESDLQRLGIFVERILNIGRRAGERQVRQLLQRARTETKQIVRLRRVAVAGSVKGRQ